MKNYQSGRYEKYNGFDYFIPNKLPRDLSFIDFSQENNLLKKILTAYNNEVMLYPMLNTSKETSQNLYKISLLSIKQEAYRSTKIEGTKINEEDIFFIEKNNNNTKDQKEFLNYIDALNYGLNEDLPFDSRKIKNIHKLVLKDLKGLKGEYRKNTVRIGGKSEEDAHFLPALPQYIDDLISDLGVFWYEDNGIHPLVKIALIHYQFESIHPFEDGNGRVGRIIMSMLLYENTKISTIFPISTLIENDREIYYKVLNDVSKHNDYYNLIKFISSSVLLSMQIITNLEFYQQNIILNLKIQVSREKNSKDYLEIIDIINEHQYISAYAIHQKMNRSFNTIKTRLNNLVKLSILKVVQHNNKVYYEINNDINEKYKRIIKQKTSIIMLDDYDPNII